MSEFQFARFVGLDWGNEEHVVTVVDERGKVIAKRVLKNDGQAADLLVELLRKQGVDPPQVAVAVETRELPVVEALLEAAFVIFTINPKQLDRFRDRFSIAGAKDDDLDSSVLASCLRTDMPLFTRVEPELAIYARLRRASRLRTSVVRERVALSNQLYSIVMRYFPALITICPHAGDAWFWDVLLLVERPGNIPDRLEEKLAAILRMHRIRSSMSVERIMGALQSKHLVCAAGVADACFASAKSVIERLRVVRQQELEQDEAVKAIVDEAKVEHADAQILLSLPGVGEINAAAMLGEASGLLLDRDYARLRTQSGVAPVTNRSGKQGKKGHRRKPRVTMRRARNNALADAVFSAAWSATNQPGPFKDLYVRKKAEGCEHPAAVRSVGDKLLRVLVALLEKQEPYNAAYQLPR
jgi:transposase